MYNNPYPEKYPDSSDSSHNKCNCKSGSKCKTICSSPCDYQYINKCVGKILNKCFTYGPDCTDVFGNDFFCQELDPLDPKVGGFLKLTNWIQKDSLYDVYVQFDYVVEGDWEIVYANAIFGNGNIICILDKAINTPDTSLSGTFCAPIGRPIDVGILGTLESKPVIRYLTFCLRQTNPDEDAIFNCNFTC